jgi:ubiquitin carboxyl-terminal hydrolase 16
MPDKQLTIATYAAGASLAAITLVYVFAPTFFIDGESANSASSRKKGVVGLSNSANDCFINSVLQALAGLGDLRLYLIRETHRRKLDGSEIYAHPVSDPARQGLSAWKIQGEQEGIVTHGLKDILDALNERPLYKKTISPAGFISCLELAFKQRVSRQQQDAQEFLQILAERLCEEYHAGHRARNYARKALISTPTGHTLDVASARQSLQSALKNVEESEKHPTIGESETTSQETTVPSSSNGEEGQDGEKETGQNYTDEEGFPLEGGSESQIECLTCGFKPEPTKSTFCVLTLSVPQVSSTTLSSCFDQMFKTEYIEGFKCEKCRLVHALNSYQEEMAVSNSEKFKAKARNAIEKLQAAIETNPEAELKDVDLPNSKFAPKRKIAKHVRITRFPKIMAIHLSRSIFEERLSIKNSAKVAFPERLPLGGLLDQRMYKLLSVVCHKGSHHAGHYESFRRQNLYPPFSTPNTFQASGVYSKSPTPNASRISTPIQRIVNDANVDSGTPASTPELLSPPSASSASLPLANGRLSGTSTPNVNGRTHTTTTKATSPGSRSRDTETDTSSIRSVARSARESISSKISLPRLRSTADTLSSISPNQLRPSTDNSTATETVARTPLSDIVRVRKRKSPNNRWWRISDEKIKESKTSDLLGMQKEVYLLFYELEAGDDDA